MKQPEDRIAIYSRKSKFTGKGESIGNQVELCKDYVRNFFGKASADSCVVFEDEGFSGGNLKRPDFQRLLADVRKGRFRAIVVYRLDRISRNISDFTGLIDELTRLNVAFVSIREQFDTCTPMGRAMMFIISVFSQLERETIAERIRDNMQELAKTGRWLGGNTPTGFRSDAVSNITVDGKVRKSYKLVPIPEQMELVKQIFDLYTETDSLTAVETELLRQRRKTKQGKDFTRFAIKGILQNPVYMTADADAYAYFREREAEVCFPEAAFDGTYGIMAYNRTCQEKGKTTILLPVSRWIIAIGQQPGSVPARQWIRIQASLERNKSKAYRKPRTNAALLTGLLFCACGSRMYPKLSQRRRADGTAIFTYVCKRKERSKGQCCCQRNVSGNLLDEAVLEEIQSLEEDDLCLVKELEKDCRYAAESRDPSEFQLDALQRECRENERTINCLIDSLGALGESIALPRILNRIEELTETNRRIENRIREVKEAASSGIFPHEELERLRQRLSVFGPTVGDASVEEKRTIVHALIQKVVWDGKTAHVVVGAQEDL